MTKIQYFGIEPEQEDKSFLELMLEKKVVGEEKVSDQIELPGFSQKVRQLDWKTDVRLYWKNSFPFSARFVDSILGLYHKNYSKTSKMY